MGLALLGDKLSAEQAQARGMIWQVVDDEQLSATVQQMALHFASQPTFGTGLIKQAINAAETNTLDAQLDLERDYQRPPDAATTTGKASARSGKTRARLYGEIIW